MWSDEKLVLAAEWAEPARNDASGAGQQWAAPVSFRKEQQVAPGFQPTQLALAVERTELVMKGTNRAGQQQAALVLYAE